MPQIEKMKSFTAVLFLLIGFTGAFGAGSHWIDFRLASESTFSPQRNVRATIPTCTATGRVCDDTCKQIWICSNNGGVLQPGLIQTCSGNDTCNNGVCSATPTPECAPSASKPFVCQAEGVFPDPTTCKKYHYCIKDDKGDYIDYLRVCPQHYGFNPGTTYCAKNLTNNHCGNEYPVPICTEPGQTGALKDNKSMYYLCLLYGNTGTILYPYLQVCPNGQSYDVTTFGCK